MNTYLALFLMATACSLAITPLIRRLCERQGWVDVPRDGRRVHERPVPRLGGVAVFASILISLAFVRFIHTTVGDTVRQSIHGLLMLFVPGALILAVGVLDDLRSISPKLKFCGELAAAGLFFWMGGAITQVTLPFLGTIHLAGLVSLLATALWVVGITNAFNLIDGVDGLASGAGLFAAGVLMAVSVAASHTLVAAVCIALIGALVGFLRYNFNPASIFLGDSGSLFIGFLLAGSSILGFHKASTVVAIVIPPLAFAVPVVDTAFSIVRRYLGRRPLFEGDREHIHHKLLAFGWSQRRVVLVLYGFSAIFGLLALLMLGNPQGKMTGLVLVVIAVTVIFAVGRLGYDEFDEVGQSMRRNFSERRVRFAGNLRIRRTREALAKARSLPDILSAILEVGQAGEFSRIRLELVLPDASTPQPWPPAPGPGAWPSFTLQQEGACVCWAARLETSEPGSADSSWQIEIPLDAGQMLAGRLLLHRPIGARLLIDVNYLTGFFRAELVRALTRALGLPAESREAAAVEPARLGVAQG